MESEEQGNPPAQSIDVFWVDIPNRTIQPARFSFASGRIIAIEFLDDDAGCEGFLLPGFIDAHIHIESSMLTPSQFARVAVTHGTVGTVSDPHEIANVLGIRGVEYMLDDASRVPFKFCFGAPSCVPATRFETAGARIDVSETETLLDDSRIGYLAEMMNFPGVLQREPEVLAKIQAARERGKPVDGHAPGLRGDAMREYFASGIGTDHECFTEAEAVEKLEAGVIIQIREGSAAKNFEALKGLIDRYPSRIMFCSDDKHPDELLSGHINQLCQRAVAAGSDLFNVLTAACITPVKHYGLAIGQLNVGDPADFVIVDSLETFGVRKTFVDGQLVAARGSMIEVSPADRINQFECDLKSDDDFHVPATHSGDIRVIVARDQLLTTSMEAAAPLVHDGCVVADPTRDLLKLAVVNRYRSAPPAIGFVRGIGIQQGAMASSVAHDSHNIVAVGVSDQELARAVNSVIECKGGLCVVQQDEVHCLPLPIAGLMSPDPCEVVAKQYQELDRLVKSLCVTDQVSNEQVRHLHAAGLQAPFMTLSFLALLVIPSLKLSDLGLFDGDRFEFCDLFTS